MGQRYFPHDADENRAFSLAQIDDAAAVYPDHDIVTRHFDGPSTIGDFVSAFVESAEGHGGLPTYLRLTLRSDATKLRRLIGGRHPRARGSKQTSH